MIINNHVSIRHTLYKSCIYNFYYSGLEYGDLDVQQHEQFGRMKFATVVEEINKSKRDVNTKVEESVSNDYDDTEQPKKSVEDADNVIKGVHQGKKGDENLKTKPVLSSKGDSEVQMIASKGKIERPLAKLGPKYDAKTQDNIQHKSPTSGISHANTLPSVKPSKSCETLARNFIKQSERKLATQRPTFYKSSNDINISVHIYEAIPDVETKRGMQKSKSHTNMAKFSTRKDPYLSKEVLRAGYKHREPPPHPRKAQSKESIDYDDIVHTDSSINSVCHHSSAKLVTSQQTEPTMKANSSRTSSAYKHQPPPPRHPHASIQSNLPSKGQSSIHVRNTSSSDSSSTSEDVLSFLWSKGVGTVNKTQHDCQHELVYQPLNPEDKAPMTLYESLNKCSDLGHTKPKSASGDESDQAGNINVQEFQENEPKRQPQYHEIGKGTDDQYSHSDSEGDYMPLVPKRKKNTVVVEYQSLHFVRQNQ